MRLFHPSTLVVAWGIFPPLRRGCVLESASGPELYHISWFTGSEYGGGSTYWLMAAAVGTGDVI